LSGRGLCDELITRPEESYRLWCVVMCDLETPRIGAPYIYIYDISSLRVNFYYRINFCLCQLATHNAMKTGGKAEVQLHAFLTSTPDLSSGQLQYFVHKPPHFPLEMGGAPEIVW